LLQDASPGANQDLTRSGFTGHQHDNDLGLVDMGGRIYDPLAGRFMSPDPIMQAPYWSQGQNRYSYVFNDPINFTDPSGFEAAAGGAGLMGGLMVGGLVNVGIQSGVITAGGVGVGLIGGALNVTMTSLVSPFRGSEGGTYQVPSTATAAATTTGSKHAPVPVAQNRPPGPLTMPDRPPGSSLFDPEMGALACGGLPNCLRVAGQAARQIGPALARSARNSWRWWAYQFELSGRYWAYQAGRAANAIRAMRMAGQTTKLYRAVDPTEYAELAKTGKFAASQNSLGGKFFAESAADAAKWGDRLHGAGKFRIIEAELPRNAADQLMRWERLDGIGPARYGELEQLGKAVVRALP
jgi:RHS repeat-associated protein